MTFRSLRFIPAGNAAANVLLRTAVVPAWMIWSTGCWTRSRTAPAPGLSCRTIATGPVPISSLSTSGASVISRAGRTFWPLMKKSPNTSSLSAIQTKATSGRSWLTSRKKLRKCSSFLRRNTGKRASAATCWTVRKLLRISLRLSAGSRADDHPCGGA